MKRVSTAKRLLVTALFTALVTAGAPSASADGLRAAAPREAADVTTEPDRCPPPWCEDTSWGG
ncbi:hypothetical protein AB0M39_07815 [Streptomyces sp. NPDC051907]|uniref:hypothetical protein n=1 Tax=Streptomyces sp. NPDC051907 TaxID=3155284 RepID=UPI00343ED098